MVESFRNFKLFHLKASLLKNSLTSDFFYIVIFLTLSTPGYWDVVISRGGVLRTRTPENAQMGPISKYFLTSLRA